jgi:hypothetical protein
MSAGAQFAKTEDAIKSCQSAMFIQRQHVARLGAMAGGRVPYDATSPSLRSRWCWEKVDVFA